jgi:molecular chaperone IbpA
MPKGYAKTVMGKNHQILISSLIKEIKMTGLNINHLTPFAVGFDRVFDRLVEFPQTHAATGFPPYNIRRNKDGDKFTIELALAGLDINDVDIEVKEDILTVKSTWDEKPEDESVVLHKGISHKKFTRSFTLADDLEVIGANFKNGLLVIALERIIPEEKRPKKIKIDNKKEFLVG